MILISPPTIDLNTQDLSSITENKTLTGPKKTKSSKMPADTQEIASDDEYEPVDFDQRDQDMYERLHRIEHEFESAPPHVQVLLLPQLVSAHEIALRHETELAENHQLRAEYRELLQKYTRLKDEWEAGEQALDRQSREIPPGGFWITMIRVLLDVGFVLLAYYSVLHVLMRVMEPNIAFFIWTLWLYYG
jgi:hypothetical protein